MPWGNNVTAAWRPTKGLILPIPCLHRSIHLYPVTGDHQNKLDADVSRSAMTDGSGFKNKTIPARPTIFRKRGIITWNAGTRSFGNLVPATSWAAKERCDAGYGLHQRNRPFTSTSGLISSIHYGKAEGQSPGYTEPDEATLVSLGKEVVKEEYGKTV